MCVTHPSPIENWALAFADAAADCEKLKFLLPAEAAAAEACRVSNRPISDLNLSFSILICKMKCKLGLK